MSLLICLLVALTALAALPFSASAELPPFETNHPRLIHDAAGWAALHEDILAEEHRFEVWETLKHDAAVFMDWEMEPLFLDSFAFETVEWYCLIIRMEPGPLAQQARDALAQTLLYQMDHWDAEPDSFLMSLGPTLRLHNLSWAYDHAFEDDAAMREQIVDEMLVYLDAMTSERAFTQFLYNPHVSNKGISIGANLVLASLALAPDLPDEPLVAEARELGEALLAKDLGDLFGADGSYGEGIGYMSWAFRTLLPAWRALERIEGVQSWNDDQIRNLLDWIAYQMLSTGHGHLLNRNDFSSSSFTLSRHHSILEWATSHGPDPSYARWILRRVSGDLGNNLGAQSDAVATLLYHDDGPETAPAWLAPSRVFEDSGFYVRRRGWPGDPLEPSYLVTIEAGRFMGGHRQEDVGQVILRGMGMGFALDNGFSSRAKETEGHNLPLAGGRGQHNAGSAIGTDGSLALLLATPFCECLRADMTSAYTTHSPFNDMGYPFPDSDWSWGYDGGNPMSVAWREMLVLPGDDGEMPEIYLRDLLVPQASSGPRVFQWRQHLARNLTLTEAEAGLWLASGPGGSLRCFLHGPPAEETSYAVEDFENESLDPDTQVFELNTQAENAEFLWQWNLLPPDRAGPQSATDRLPGGLRLRSNEGERSRRILVSRGAEPGSLAFEGDSLEGGWGLIEERDGRTRSLLLEGTKLTAAGRSLVRLHPSGSAAFDGERVFLSDSALAFFVYAPEAEDVLAGEQSLPFVRLGDYVADPNSDWPEPPAAPIFLLSAPWPNPGAPPLSFRVTLDVPDQYVGLELYDVTGRRVRRLGGTSEDGSLVLRWDGRDDEGQDVVNGIYLARCRLGDRERRSKVLLLRP